MATPLATSVGLLSRALDLAGRLANDAAEVITATAGRMAGPDSKAHPFDWVTETDRTLERHTRRVIAAEFPGSAVLGEEYGGPDGSDCLLLPGTPGAPDLLWIVDPVDGTSNYVAGIPWCCYSLALVDAHGPLVGVIADPYQGQIYAAARGLGLRANGRRVPPTALDTLAGTVVFVEPSKPGRRPELAPLIDRARSAHVGLRMMGSSALAITQVALGRASAAVLPSGGYHVWDIAGALTLAVEAGMTVSDLDGRPGLLPLDGVIVTAPHVTEEVLALVSGR
ncbi:myo-inositol-1(or 4)-monophosphatase [Nakamurella panacisegetis]|uniref:Myo-inositol-1(Or 4)-monophosphatase n=1 Tax=Nakamurella panacisegetis TaxID=1090615 RepID=A0A1H0NUD2_9ACTN|nr:inositol monophosphatase [Nakamurella panacisegetis]SDO96000.1 myo-inositol-1(or 4)-monophosphatase [Nakamurella panacisegetis]